MVEEARLESVYTCQRVSRVRIPIPLPSITLEIVGNWLWVTGSTYPVRQQLKDAGLFFASKKAAWYYRTEEYKTRGTGESLDEIRAKYGTETVGSRQHYKLIE